MAQTRALIVCTANVCRSPVVERLFAASLRAHGISNQTSSAGTHGGTHQVHRDTLTAASELGIDLRPHKSRLLTRELIETEGADLIVTMTRAHLYRVVELQPAAFERTFTLLELTQLAQQHGIEPLTVDVGGWADAIGAGRTASDVSNGGGDYDLNDPYGQPVHEHRQMVRRVRSLTSQVMPMIAASVDPAIVSE